MMIDWAESPSLRSAGNDTVQNTALLHSASTLGLCMWVLIYKFPRSLAHTLSCTTLTVLMIIIRD